MIVLDTHIWIWWVDQNPKLLRQEKEYISNNQSGEIGISVFSLWEVAKLVEKQKLFFSVSLEAWFEKAITRPHLTILPLTPKIIIESTQLPGDFHKDPVDQALVATARIYDCPLITYDSKILNYPHVKQLPK